MDIYIEELIGSDSFLQFTIGKELDLSHYLLEKDYNLIGDKGSAYYFFNSSVDVEVYLKDGLVYSVDILLHNQDNEVFLGTEDKRLSLKECTLDGMITYLNKNYLNWKFREHFQRSIAIEYHSELRIVFHFDCEKDSSLSLIHLYK